MHSGNVIIDREGHVKLVDCGIVLQLSPKNKEDFRLLFNALMRKDGVLVRSKCFPFYFLF